MAKTALGYADDHACDDRLCRVFHVASEVVTLHGAVSPEYVTIQSFSGFERLDPQLPMTQRLLESMGIDWV